MATYNGARYIEEQLQSFVDQERRPDELVISDDCSKDETVRIIEGFAKKAPFEVKLSVNKKNLGYAGNFNAALMKTSGDLVFLSDQDDVWYPQKIKRMLSSVSEKPDFFVYMNDAQLTDQNLNPVKLTKYGQIKSGNLGDESFVMGCCCAIRREYLDFVLPIPADLKAHDNWLVEIADGLKLKVILPEVLQFYRRHENNESQFIANSLKPLNKWSAYSVIFRRLIRGDSKALVEQKINQINSFVNSLEKMSKAAPFKYQSGIYSLIEQYKREVDLHQNRAVIRGEAFFKRVLAAFSFYREGVYPKGSRLRNLIRDIIGD